MNNLKFYINGNNSVRKIRLLTQFAPPNQHKDSQTKTQKFDGN